MIMLLLMCYADKNLFNQTL